MENIYTMEDWALDVSFSAEELQEVDRAVYWEMLECLPPKSLPEITAQKIKGINAGFLVGEPHGFNNKGTTYAAFGKTEDDHYYFLGYSNTAKTLECDPINRF